MQYKSIVISLPKPIVVGIVQVILKVLDNHRKKIYVAPRVLQQGLHFLDQAVSHAITWKVVKGHYPVKRT